MGHETGSRGLKSFIATFLKDRDDSSGGFTLRPVPADGSERRFYRVLPETGAWSLMVLENPPVSEAARRENSAYLYIGRHLRDRGAPIPRIHFWDLGKGWFILDDLGDCKLYDEIAGGADPLPLYTEAIEVLLHMQIQGIKGFDTSWCCQTPAYDRDLMLKHESGYFTREFLERYLRVPVGKGMLQEQFEYLADAAAKAGADRFMHRDFQSRNLILTNQGLAVLDWQGGRPGPPGYDLASLIIDPYANLDKKTAQHIYNAYISRLSALDPLQASLLEETYPYLAIQRNLQVLGAYTFLSRVRKKRFFEDFIPRAFESLKALLVELGDPQLRPLLRFIQSLPGLIEKKHTT
ncbi:MAG: aminoglycoside phosphotransferase family protein [Desulfobacteraceae bacterium]